MPLPTLLVKGNLARPAEPDRVPLEYILEWLKKRMPEFGGTGGALEDRILVVKSKTGSGKSTALPVAVFRLLRGEKTPPRQPYGGKSVICTQPRVLTAKSLAEDVSSRPFNPDMVLGKTVGYQTGAFAMKPPRGLIYATIGTLRVQLGVLADSDIMSMYRFILVDEAHERSLDADLTLMLIKQFYERNAGDANLPFLLLASATIDTQKYADYFGVPKNVVEVEGRAFGVRTHWPAEGSNNYVQAAAETALRIHRGNLSDPPEEADILIFMPGGTASQESKQLAELLQKENQALPPDIPPFLVLQVDGDVVRERGRDYYLVFAPPDELRSAARDVRPARRIIVSSNVAETGLTIDTLKYVIDSGWMRTVENYPLDGVSGLVTKPAPKSRIEQRKGRAGRLFPGEFYPLYTKNVWQALEDMQKPEIVTEGPAAIMPELLAGLARGAGTTQLDQSAALDLSALDMLDNPPEPMLWAAYERAILAGLVSEVRSESARPQPYLTEYGEMVAKTSLRMEEAGFLAAALRHGLNTTDALTILAYARAGKTALYGRPPRRPGAVPPYGEALREGLPLAWRGAAGAGDLPPTPSEQYYYRFRLAVADDFIEGLLVLSALGRKITQTLGNLVKIREWCDDVHISYDGAMGIIAERAAITDELVLAGFEGAAHPASDAQALSTREDVGEFMAGVVAIKYALYEGFRVNVLEYEERRNVYVRSQPALSARSAPGRDSSTGALPRSDPFPIEVPKQFSDVELSRLRGLGLSASIIGGSPALEHGGSTLKPATSLSKPRLLVTNELRLAAGKDQRHLTYVVKTGLTSVLDGFVGVDSKFLAPRQIE